MALIRFKEEGERAFGWFWHIAYYDPFSPRVAYAPIPLNWVIKGWRWIYAHIGYGWLDRIVRAAYNRGKADGERSGRDFAHRMWMDVFSRIEQIKREKK